MNGAMNLADYFRLILGPAAEADDRKEIAIMEAAGYQLIRPVNRSPYFRRRRGWKSLVLEDRLSVGHGGQALRVRIPSGHGQGSS